MFGYVYKSYYTPICAHGPPFDTTPALLYKPIGILDVANSNCGSGISFSSLRFEIKAKSETIAITMESPITIMKGLNFILKKKIILTFHVSYKLWLNY